HGPRAASGPGGAPEEVRDGRRSTPYLLLLPGMAWLVRFFAVPVCALASLSLQTRVPGAEIGVYTQTFRWANYSDALAEYAPQFLRSFLYAGLGPLRCLLLGYPLAYAIALKAGRWRNLMLIAVIAPFFTSFILRTIAWRQVLAASGPVTSTLHTLHILPPGESLTASGTAVVAGLTYNFLPFMVLPPYAALEALDAPAGACCAWCCRCVRRWRGPPRGGSRRPATCPPPRRSGSAGSRCRCRCPAWSP